MNEESDARFRTALLLLDMENEVVKGHGPPFETPPERRGFIANARRLLLGARETGVPVIFVKVERRADHSDYPTTVADRAATGAYRPRLVAGTPGAAIVDELTPLPEELVLIKRRMGAFYGTSLEIYLRIMRIEQLVIAGAFTNMGVETTVREARDRDLQIIVLADACAARTPELHQIAVTQTIPWLARIRDTDHVLALFTALASRMQGGA